MILKQLCGRCWKRKMIETEKRRRRPAGFKRLAGRRFLYVLGDGGDMSGRVKKEKKKNTAAAFGRC